MILRNPWFSVIKRMSQKNCKKTDWSKGIFKSKTTHCIVVNIRPGYYLILDSFGQRSRYISIKFPFKNSLKILGCAPVRNFTVIKTFALIKNYLLLNRLLFSYEIDLSIYFEMILIENASPHPNESCLLQLVDLGKSGSQRCATREKYAHN